MIKEVKLPDSIVQSIKEEMEAPAKLKPMTDDKRQMNIALSSYAEKWWTLKTILNNTYVNATLEGKSVKAISEVLDLMEELEVITNANRNS